MINDQINVIKLLNNLEDFMFSWNVKRLPKEFVEEVTHYIRAKQRKAYGGLEEDFQSYLKTLKSRDRVLSGFNKRGQPAAKV